VLFLYRINKVNLDLNKHIEQQINKTLNFKGVYNWQFVGGGSINKTYKLSSNNHFFFVKINAISVFKNGFKEEVLGLKFLEDHKTLTPKIIAEGIFKNNCYLVLEYIECGIKTQNFWKNFALQLANLHQQNSDYFGLNHNNFMGQLPQNNSFKKTFIEFFIENRLQPQVSLAFNNNLISKQLLLNFENLHLALKNIIPKENPCAVHGDLWSGNFICNSKQKAVLIDPAVYYGHREIDLAMTYLFGGFSSQFYQTYFEIYPLEKEFNFRKDIYNLYPLLIHLNLFGSSYLQDIKKIVYSF